AALPAGYIGGRIGRRTTIMTGIVLMGAVIALVYVLPSASLLMPLAPLPVVGISLAEGGASTLTLIGALLMVVGVAWAFININSLPMVVDMTTAERIGTYTGLYYLFSTLAAIVGPNVNGWVVDLTGDNYNNIMLAAPIFLAAA